MNKRDRRISIGHLTIGVMVGTVGAWSSHGDLVGGSGLISLLGCLTILLELPHVTDDMAARQKRIVDFASFSTDRPTTSGWYEVIWEPGDAPQKVYLSVTEDGICWGHNETDDPEAIELDVAYPELIQFRPAE